MMPLKYLVEGGTQYAPDYEYKYLVYGPRNGFKPGPEGKAQCQRECYFIREMENRWARPVLMEDGRWIAYASYAKKDD
tara:strand:- start:364 stop:597 length:234 start_codon:yes stop_codon:yes gene_type:complete